MKKLILLAIMSSFALSGFTTSTNVKNASSIEEQKILCKSSIKYALAYKDTMTKDEASKTALDYYKKDVVANCGTISARAS
jgi:hypothetical protein